MLPLTLNCELCVTYIVLNPGFLGIANLLYYILYSTVDCHIVGLLLNNDKLYCVLLCDSAEPFGDLSSKLSVYL